VAKQAAHVLGRDTDAVVDHRDSHADRRQLDAQGDALVGAP
jgi:hypothetical protein